VQVSLTRHDEIEYLGSDCHSTHANGGERLVVPEVIAREQLCDDGNATQKKRRLGTKVNSDGTRCQFSEACTAFNIALKPTGRGDWREACRCRWLYIVEGI